MPIGEYLRVFEVATHSALDPHDAYLYTLSMAATCMFCRFCLRELDTAGDHQHAALITAFWVRAGVVSCWMPKLVLLCTIGAAERAIFGSIKENRIVKGTAYAADDNRERKALNLFEQMKLARLAQGCEPEPDRNRRAPLQTVLMARGAEWVVTVALGDHLSGALHPIYEMWPAPIRAHARI